MHKRVVVQEKRRFKRERESRCTREEKVERERESSCTRK